MDLEGNFVFRFKVIVDFSIDKKDKFVFIFKIIVDVIDISGEIYFVLKNIKLVYFGFEIFVKLLDVIDRGDFFSVVIDIRNLDG